MVSESEMGKARALVARYKARLRAQRKQKGGKGRGRLLQASRQLPEFAQQARRRRRNGVVDLASRHEDGYQVWPTGRR